MTPEDAKADWAPEKKAAYAKLDAMKGDSFQTPAAKLMKA